MLYLDHCEYLNNYNNHYKIIHISLSYLLYLIDWSYILNKYNLTELSSSQYLMRTFENVQASDGTLIIHQGKVSGGTLKTKDYCQMINKSFFEVNLLENLEKIPLNFDTWIKENHIIIMNIAGPRESAAPIYNRTYALLMDLLSHYKR